MNDTITKTIIDGIISGCGIRSTLARCRLYGCALRYNSANICVSYHRMVLLTQIMGITHTISVLAVKVCVTPVL